VALRWRAVSATLAPTAFVAQNQAFDLAPNGQVGALRFADPVNPLRIDLPQRFGDGRYARLDPGQSTVRVDAYGLTAGVSTANLWWGPMTELPYLLGNNAAGFAHVFAGSARPWNLLVGRGHGRIVYGRLSQSAHSSAADSARERFASGIIATFSPRGLPGFEIGAARFFHADWPDRGFQRFHFTKIVESIYKRGVRLDPGDVGTGGNDTHNQLASLYARWVLPRAGLEVYGEMGREDHSGEGNNLLQEPGHTASRGLGLARSWAAPRHVTSLRAEMLTFEQGPSPTRRLNAGVTYLHTVVRQGHTQRGQLLGAAIGSGGASGSVVALDRAGADGRWAVSWTRATPHQTMRLADDMRSVTDVQHALHVERSVVRGSVEWTSGVTGVWEYYRNFRDDAGNLQLALSARWLAR
jgi:hypothetical protein